MLTNKLVIMPLNSINCPHCGRICNVDLSTSVHTCLYCGKPLFGEEIIKDIPSAYLNAINALEANKTDVVDYIKLGFLYRTIKDYKSIYNLGLEMKGCFPYNFWTYLFLAIGETHFDLLSTLPEIDYKLTKEEINEDMKSRIYHYARNKYSTVTSMMYNEIADKYPDTPGETRGKWHKCKTQFENKLNKLLIFKKNNSIIKNLYLRNMEMYASNEKEMAIVHNFNVWSNRVDFAFDEIKRYERNSENFVIRDYEKTPDPGNKPNFFMNISLFIGSLIVFLLSIFEIISIYVQAINMPKPVIITLSILSSILLLIISIFFIFKKNLLFNKKNPVITFGLCMLVGFIVVFGIISSFQPLAFGWYQIFNLIISILGGVFSLYKAYKNQPRNTYINDTYIGNFKALANNSFQINFSFNWKNFVGAHEFPLHTQEQYLSELEKK